jgi:uncharacterized protein YkwD
MLLTACLAFVLAASPVQQPAPAQMAERERDLAIWQVLDLTNAERLKRNLHPLKLNPYLSEAARWMGEDMAAKGYFSHTDSFGRNVGQRARSFGYAWSCVGENLAAGHETPLEVVTGWMESPGHRTNILRPEFDEIGLAYVVDRNSLYRRYWVQVFASR